jgi:hypothetical protein
VQIDILRDPQFVSGMGYVDGWRGDMTTPKAWFYWTPPLQHRYVCSWAYGRWAESQSRMRKILGF